MNIYFNGGSSFLLETSKGKRILLDPINLLNINEKINSNIDLVTISHNHNHINFKSILPHNIKVIDSPVEFSNDFCRIKPYSSFHDNHNGQKRGTNTIFKINCDGFYLCHLGHLGHKLIPASLNSLKGIDVLFVPVGAYFTIGLDDLCTMINEIKPKYIIPMDYKIKGAPLYLKSLDSFLLKMGNYPVENLPYLSLNENSKQNKSTIIILDINKKKTLAIN